jgi:hypothetical protein
MKTSELIGAQLDWAVGIANGWVTYPTDSVERGQYFHTNRLIAPRGHEHNLIRAETFQPSTDWAQGGPIIEREQIAMWPEAHGGAIGTETSSLWFARIYYNSGEQHDSEQPAASPLIAAMRCYVASKLGDDVEIPKELS